MKKPKSIGIVPNSDGIVPNHGYFPSSADIFDHYKVGSEHLSLKWQEVCLIMWLGKFGASFFASIPANPYKILH